METKPLLMGSEVEYSMPNSRPPASQRMADYHTLLLDAIRADHAWLPDIRNGSGIYLDNGSRYYLDSGNHNEFSSPEVSTPRQIAIYDRAAEHILRRAKARVESRFDGTDLCITKNNINFSLADRATWGQHEAFTCWIPLPDAAMQLVPHLVSRIPYAGAGCLSAHPDGMGFELSQRSRHMTRVQGSETTRDRAIFCTRAWKSSDVSQEGWTRTNLISKDSQRCSFGMYLTFGVTGLLFMIMNEGNVIGQEVQLKNPVTAMRTFSLDPWLRAQVPLANGKQATAIEIQRAYLREATLHLERGSYPSWTEEVLRHWSTTLDQLEQDPLQLADKLDTYLKLMIFEHQLRRGSLTWARLRQSLKLLEEFRRTPPPVFNALLREDSSGLSEELLPIYEQLINHRELRRVGLEQLRFALRLQAAELNYHELGGLFDQLEACGQVDSVVVTPEDVEQAIGNPPPDGRAKVRGQWITELSGKPWACDWECVVNQADGHWINLQDPFSNQRSAPASIPPLPKQRRSGSFPDVLVRIAE